MTTIQSPRRPLALLAILLTAILVGSTAPAFARGGGADVVRSGACSRAAHWKLKAGRDDGRIEVEAEVDSNHAGQTWRWSMRHDGTLFTSGTRRTAGRSGSFEVRRLITDRAGADVIRFYARRPATGQTCSGAIRL